MLLSPFKGILLHQKQKLMKEITFNELSNFTKQVESILGGDDELMALQIYLAENPTKGDVIPKSHGLRKLRW